MPCAAAAAAVPSTAAAAEVVGDTERARNAANRQAEGAAAGNGPRRLQRLVVARRAGAPLPARPARGRRRTRCRGLRSWQLRRAHHPCPPGVQPIDTTHRSGRRGERRGGGRFAPAAAAAATARTAATDRAGRTGHACPACPAYTVRAAATAATACVATRVPASAHATASPDGHGWLGTIPSLQVWRGRDPATRRAAPRVIRNSSGEQRAAPLTLGPFGPPAALRGECGGQRRWKRCVKRWREGHLPRKLRGAAGVRGRPAARAAGDGLGVWWRGAYKALGRLRWKRRRRWPIRMLSRSEGRGLRRRWRRRHRRRHRRRQLRRLQRRRGRPCLRLLRRLLRRLRQRRGVGWRGARRGRHGGWRHRRWQRRRRRWGRRQRRRRRRWWHLRRRCGGGRGRLGGAAGRLQGRRRVVGVVVVVTRWRGARPWVQRVGVAAIGVERWRSHRRRHRWHRWHGRQAIGRRLPSARRQHGGPGG